MAAIGTRFCRRSLKGGLGGPDGRPDDRPAAVLRVLSPKRTLGSTQSPSLACRRACISGPCCYGRGATAPVQKAKPVTHTEVQWQRRSERNTRLHASSQEAAQQKAHNSSVVFWSSAVIITGTLNRIFYKMALKPLSNYVFFLAQFQTFAYTAVYGTILYLTYRAGKVTKDQVVNNDRRLVLGIGLAEASALVLGFLGAAMLPGVVLPLLQQSYLLWQILVNKLLLGKNLQPIELVGAALVGFGVCFSAWPSGDGGGAFSEASPVGIALFTVSLFLLVFATLAKERVFDESEARTGKPLNIFVVNTFGSAAQGLFVALLMPLLLVTQGMSMSQLPNYLAQGWRALRGLTPSCGTDCSSAPLLACTYIAMNLAYNISVLNLLKSAGNVAMSLASSVLIPLTIWAFTWPWPVLDPTPALGTNFFIGASVMLLGLFVFNAPIWRPMLSKGSGGSSQPAPA